MSEAVRAIAPSPLDHPGRRLIWIVPLALMLWFALLLVFSRWIAQAPPPLELKPVEARIVELPPMSGLQGETAPTSVEAPKAVSKPHAMVVRKPVPVVRPRTAIHHREKVKQVEKVKPVVPPALPAPSGVAASPGPAVPPAASSSHSVAGGDVEGGGVAGGTGSGGGAGLGNDSGGAHAIYAPVPRIPDELREDAFAAVAIAHFKVSYDGKVEVSLTRPTSNPRLNQILIDTLRQWRFFPALKNGVAVASQFDVRIPITVQ